MPNLPVDPDLPPPPQRPPDGALRRLGPHLVVLALCAAGAQIPHHEGGIPDAVQSAAEELGGAGGHYRGGEHAVRRRGADGDIGDCGGCAGACGWLGGAGGGGDGGDGGGGGNGGGAAVMGRGEREVFGDEVVQSVESARRTGHGN